MCARSAFLTPSTLHKEFSKYIGIVSVLQSIYLEFSEIVLVPDSPDLLKGAPTHLFDRQP